MRVAILSDLHANAFALEAVQRHARLQGVEACWFLGDALGYGPHPIQALEFWQELPSNCWVPGNHDALHVNVLSDKAVNDQASLSHKLNREVLKQRPDLVDWLMREFPAPSDWVKTLRFEDNVYTLVHGALYRDPQAEQATAQHINENLPVGKHIPVEAILPLHHLTFYMWPWLTINDFSRELEQVSLLRGSTMGRACVFSGHTHIPQFWVLDGVHNDVAQAIYQPICYGKPYMLTTRPTLVNPGSVGQPRDGDSRAS